MLANLLETAGVELTGVVLQASVLDYHTNCGVLPSAISCAGYVPAYAAVANHYGVVDRGVLDQQAFLQQARGFAQADYDPAIVRFFAFGTPPDESVIDVLARFTGISEG